MQPSVRGPRSKRSRASVGRFLFVVLGCSVVVFDAWAEFDLPAWPSAQAQVACQLRVETTTASGAKLDTGFCSGTLIPPNRFITSAHCMVGRDAVGLLESDSNESIYVACPGGRKSRVKLSIVNRGYFPGTDVLKGGEIEPNPARFGITAYDSALLLLDSEINALAPIVPVTSSRLADHLLRLGGCSLLGYARRLCDAADESKCLRRVSQFSNHPNGFVSSDRAQIDHGDSGGGLICIGDNEQQFLVGLATTIQKEHQFLVLASHEGFFERLLSLSDAELEDEAKTVRLSKAYRDARTLLRKTVTGLSDFVGSPVEVTCVRRFSTCIGALFALSSAVESESPLVLGLRASGISNILIDSQPRGFRVKEYLFFRRAYERQGDVLYLSPDITAEEVAKIRP